MTKRQGRIARLCAIRLIHTHTHAHTHTHTHDGNGDKRGHGKKSEDGIGEGGGETKTRKKMHKHLKRDVGNEENLSKKKRKNVDNKKVLVQ